MASLKPLALLYFCCLLLQRLSASRVCGGFAGVTALENPGDASGDGDPDYKDEHERKDFSHLLSIPQGVIAKG
jgi:hypothetical protein